MYTTPGGLHSYSPSLFQEHYQGFLGAAHAIDGSSSGSITVPAREEIQTHSQGHYGETPENSPRGGYHQDSLPQYESPTPRSHESMRSEGPVSVVMTTPVTGCYMQMPVVFMMIPMIPGSQQDADSQTETSPSRSAYSVHENYGNEAEPIQAQTARDSTQPSMTGVAAASREVPAGFTTLVVRNVPARYKPNMLLQEFVPDGSFDFFFLPYSFRDSKTMGVAFVNFRSHNLALRFQERWQRQFLRDHGRTKHLDVAAATYQGLVQNLKQFNPKNIARLDCAGMLPIFFDSLGNRLNSMQELKRYGVLPAAF
eukprot:TRINITY_DN2704_c0_g2_i6.p1 TRINITY_DN2704_c0_g2~~TRINITY_DN2704_c0_g2_i6.p1  ORF type:complete len:311 (-),score=42.75 TRINITY_DN2704_c0_g2_i6:223-1155(-)